MLKILILFAHPRLEKSRINRRLMEVIPKDKHSKSESSTDLKDSLAVYDTDKEEWRSFRWDFITSITSIFNSPKF